MNSLGVYSPVDSAVFSSPLLLQGAGAPFLIAPPQSLAAPVSFLRAQVTTQATFQSVDGWSEAAAGIPRFGGAAQRLLIEGQRTNQARNPRFEGAVAGSPGTLPTHMSGGTGAGVTRTVGEVGVEDGINYVDITWSGAGGQGAFELQLDGGTQAASAVGQTWTGSCFMRRTGGSLSGFGVTGLRVYELPATLQQTTQSILTLTDSPLAGQRIQVTRTLTQAPNNYTSLRVVLTPPATPWTVTLRFGWPQLEIGAFASTPILPSIDAPAAAARGADLVSATLDSLGISPNGACTVLWSGVIPQNASSGAAQSIIEIDSGAIANRFLIRNDAGGSAINLYRVTAGAGASASVGSMAAGTVMRLGLTIDGAGRAAASRDGGAVSVVTGGPSSGLTTVRLGSNAIWTENMLGETGHFRIIPAPVSDAALRELVGGLPIQA